MTIYSSLWNWSPSGQMLSGQVRTDTADWATASQIWCHIVTQDGVDVEPQLALIDQGFGLRIQLKADSTRFGLYSVTAPGTDQGGYWVFPVTLDTTQGQLPNSGQACAVFVTTPDAPGVLPVGARVCADYDANGFVIHKAPVTFLHDDPNVVPTMRWCQYCHQAFVEVAMQWSV